MRGPHLRAEPALDLAPGEAVERGATAGTIEGAADRVVHAAVVHHLASRDPAIPRVERRGPHRARAQPRDPRVDLARVGGVPRAAREHGVDRGRHARDLGEVVARVPIVVGLPDQQRRQLAILDDHEPHEVGVGQLLGPEHVVAVEIVRDRRQALVEQGAARRIDLGDDGQGLGCGQHRLGSGSHVAGAGQHHAEHGRRLAHALAREPRTDLGAEPGALVTADEPAQPVADRARE